MNETTIILVLNFVYLLHQQHHHHHQHRPHQPEEEEENKCIKMGKSNKFSLTSKSHSSTRVNPYDKITLNALNVSCPDKQVVLPKLESNGVQQAFIELYSLIIFIIALGTQYLNLYRSVWWLSATTPSSASSPSSSTTTQATKSRNSHPFNYHLIELDASQFALIFIGQSSLISILRALLNRTNIPTTITTCLPFAQQQQQQQPTSNGNSTTASQYNSHQPQHPQLQQHKRQQQQTSSTQQQQQQANNQTLDSTTLVTVVTGTVSWVCNYYLFKCAYRIWNNFGLNGVSCISYPIVVSIIMNSTHIIQVVEGCRKTGLLNLPFLTISMTLFSSHIKFDDDKLCHNCYNQPDEIRDEVERLRTIFNERLKFVLFKSILLAYYSSFVPICFAQSFLYYDYAWTAQHVAITWFSSLIMLISSSYTPHFYDVLHRSAYHFGKWQKLEARNTLVPCINWSENVIYPQSVVVKHYRGYFRSESVSNCAQPGVSSHLRYYIVFSNPKISYAAVLALLGLLLTYQMYLLLLSTEWYKLVAMTNMMLINVHSIYRLVKSLVVITKIYKEKH